MITFYILYDVLTGKPLGVFNSDKEARTYMIQLASKDPYHEKCVEWLVQPVELCAPKKVTYPRQWITVSKDTKSWRRKLIDCLLGK